MLFKEAGNTQPDGAVDVDAGVEVVTAVAAARSSARS